MKILGWGGGGNNPAMDKHPLREEQNYPSRVVKGQGKVRGNNSSRSVRSRVIYFESMKIDILK